MSDLAPADFVHSASKVRERYRAATANIGRKSATKKRLHTTAQRTRHGEPLLDPCYARRLLDEGTQRTMLIG
jgi:hypothetical protein